MQCCGIKHHITSGHCGFIDLVLSEKLKSRNAFWMVFHCKHHCTSMNYERIGMGPMQCFVHSLLRKTLHNRLNTTDPHNDRWPHSLPISRMLKLNHSCHQMVNNFQLFLKKTLTKIFIKNFADIWKKRPIQQPYVGNLSSLVGSF